jgi:hypothetical protein
MVQLGERRWPTIYIGVSHVVVDEGDMAGSGSAQVYIVI